MNWTIQDIVKWMEKTNEKIQANKKYLTKLDQAIGDGDHGINMSRGFQAVVNKVTVTNYTSVADVLKDIAMTLISNVGGSSGPLYGTIFLRLSLASKDTESLDLATWTKGLNAAVAGVKQRGKAHFGEKTLIDVWKPIATYFTETKLVDPTAIHDVAKLALESTSERMATKGRAAYLKERSIGHLDPGAMSSYLIMEAFLEVLEGGITS